MEKYPKIAIVYLSFHSEPYLDDVVSALKKINYPKDKLELVIIDNPHPEYGYSVRFIEETVMPLSGKEIPHTTLLPQKENKGFSGGNNEGIKWAIKNNFDYVFFHNNDGFIDSNCFAPLVAAMNNNRKIGVAQSLILLYPESNLINTSGNNFHYLGFGFCDDYRKPVDQFTKKNVHQISYASGAGLLMRVDLLKEYGLWDEDFFLYHEDLEYSLRLRMLGYQVAVVPDSIFYHKYQFSRSITKFYWMERNRYGVMLIFFRWPTLLLLAPMALVLELGLWLFAIKGGWTKERLQVYKYWLKLSSWKLWLKKRAVAQKMRKVRDREILKDAATGIFFQEKNMENPLLKYFGNPLMTIYYNVVVKMLIWW